MTKIKAIGFDLFNTLVTAQPHATDEAVVRLTRSLAQSGLAVEHDTFKKAHKEAALRFFAATQKDGRETHNRFWISAALESEGYEVSPFDPRIDKAVDAYFSVFFERCHLIPGTSEMLKALKGTYRLGLLSNFTHAPAAMGILNEVGLTPFFDVVLISGALGYRKPHPYVFRRLVEQLGVQKDQILFVGDDLESDIIGASQTGIQPVWTTYVLDQNVPSAPSVLSGPPQRLDLQVPRICSWEELFNLLEA